MKVIFSDEPGLDLDPAFVHLGLSRSNLSILVASLELGNQNWRVVAALKHLKDAGDAIKNARDVIVP